MVKKKKLLEILSDRHTVQRNNILKKKPKKLEIKYQVAGNPEEKLLKEQERLTEEFVSLIDILKEKTETEEKYLSGLNV